MKRRNFLFSTGLVGVSATLTGGTLLQVSDNTAYWNYPTNLSLKEVSHIQNVASNMMDQFSTMKLPKNKQLIRKTLEPAVIIKKETTKKGYQVAYKNKLGNMVFIYEKDGQQITQFG